MIDMVTVMQVVFKLILAVIVVILVALAVSKLRVKYTKQLYRRKLAAYRALRRAAFYLLAGSVMNVVLYLVFNRFVQESAAAYGVIYCLAPLCIAAVFAYIALLVFIYGNNFYARSELVRHDKYNMIYPNEFAERGDKLANLKPRSKSIPSPLDRMSEMPKKPIDAFMGDFSESNEFKRVAKSNDGAKSTVKTMAQSNDVATADNLPKKK